MRRWTVLLLAFFSGCFLGNESGTASAGFLLAGRTLPNSQAYLGWNDIFSKETGFVIERSADGTNFVLLAEVQPDTVSYTDVFNDATPVYYYRIRALLNPDSFSNVISIIRPWAKSYDSTNDDFAVTAVTTDGGIIAAAGTVSGFGDYDIWLMKLDSTGNLSWQMVFGTANVDEFPNSVIQSADAGYLVAGRFFDYNATETDGLVLKVDSNGNAQWQKRVGLNVADDELFAAQQAPDGKFVVAGSSYSFSGGADSDAWILKLDTNGDIDWQRRYGDAGNQMLASIQRASSGGYVASGTSSNRAFVIRANENGDPLWANVYDNGLNRSESVLSVVQAQDGTFFTAGYMSWTTMKQLFAPGGGGGGGGFPPPPKITVHDHFSIMHIFADGTFDWGRDYFTTDRDIATAAVMTADSGLVVAGRAGAASSDIELMKFSTSGNVIWERIYSAAASEYPTSLQKSAGGGFLVGGYSNSFSGNYDAWILSLADDGSIDFNIAGGVGFADTQGTIADFPHTAASVTDEFTTTTVPVNSVPTGAIPANPTITQQAP